ncbi:YybH family protein [Mesorhizobium sp. 1B3]|uniref:YybH family protein n=1 Tax=Mesorhizobium sp. 1B3 TaxID=3243599 RepID=UPI003D952782
MESKTDKAAIRAVIEGIEKAMHERDARAVFAHYIPDAVIFDLAPPLVSAMGTDPAKLEAWFAGWEGPIDRVTRDLVVTTDRDFAFAHGLSRTSATTRNGERAVFWTRFTMGLKRIGGRWKIVHEHESVPFYMDGSFRAAIDLEP